MTQGNELPEGSVTAKDRTEGTTHLIAAGRRNGYVLYDEIDKLLPGDDTDERVVSDLLSELASAGVEIRDDPNTPLGADADSTDVGDPDDPLAVYVREVNTVPKLTSAAETELAKRIKQGGPDVEAAKKDLIEANLRPVVAIARRYTGPQHHVLDVIVEGNTALLKAADEFDYTRGYRFSTYAALCVRRAIARLTRQDDREGS